jgi:serine protease Do
MILAIFGQPLNDESTLNYRIATRRNGDDVALTVRRDKGASETLRVHLAPPPGGAGQGHVISGRNPLGGATVSTITPASAADMGLDPFAARDGVLVTKAGQGAAASLGIQDGDIIRAVDGVTPHTVTELEAALANHSRGAWRLSIQRGAQMMNIQLGF